MTSELKKLGKAIKKIVHKMQKHLKNDVSLFIKTKLFSSSTFLLKTVK